MIPIDLPLTGPSPRSSAMDRWEDKVPVSNHRRTSDVVRTQGEGTPTKERPVACSQDSQGEHPLKAQRGNPNLLTAM